MVLKMFHNIRIILFTAKFHALPYFGIMGIYLCTLRKELLEKMNIR